MYDNGVYQDVRYRQASPLIQSSENVLVEGENRRLKKQLPPSNTTVSSFIQESDEVSQKNRIKICLRPRKTTPRYWRLYESSCFSTSLAWELRDCFRKVGRARSARSMSLSVGVQKVAEVGYSCNSGGFFVSAGKITPWNPSPLTSLGRRFAAVELCIGSVAGV